MGNFLSTAQKHNRRSFEHNRPGPKIDDTHTHIAIYAHRELTGL